MTEATHAQETREATRRRLLAQRRAIPASERRTAARAIARNVRRHFDILARYYRTQGASPALPVVVHPSGPVEFWLWHPNIPLNTGFGKLPIPAERVPRKPFAVVDPLFGFDDAGLRWMRYRGKPRRHPLSSSTANPGQGQDAGNSRSSQAAK